MSTTLKAVYESGALQILTPLSLEEGDIIEALVFERIAHEVPPGKSDARTPLEVVQEIAALSVTHDGEETASRDHDLFLYGPEGAK